MGGKPNTFPLMSAVKAALRRIIAKEAKLKKELHVGNSAHNQKSFLLAQAR